jgi:hypothetical protein
MPLPAPASHRQLRHRRTIDIHVYSRGDGLWEVDAALRDVKTRDVPMAGGVRRAGEPIHDMLLRLLVDERLNIVEAGSNTLGMPYAGQCDAHDDAYARLAGLNLTHDFRRGLRQRVGGVLGCTHLSELAQVLPTAVIQAFAGEVIDTRAEHPGAKKPFQIDRCHALRADGEVVRVHYPRWFRQPDANNGADNPARDPSTTSA